MCGLAPSTLELLLYRAKLKLATESTLLNTIPCLQKGLLPEAYVRLEGYPLAFLAPTKNDHMLFQSVSIIGVRIYPIPL